MYEVSNIEKAVRAKLYQLQNDCHKNKEIISLVTSLRQNINFEGPAPDLIQICLILDDLRTVEDLREIKQLSAEIWNIVHLGPPKKPPFKKVALTF